MGDSNPFEEESDSKNPFDDGEEEPENPFNPKLTTLSPLPPPPDLQDSPTPTPRPRFRFRTAVSRVNWDFFWLFPRERFLDPPPPLLSILYMDLKCKT